MTWLSPEDAVRKRGSVGKPVFHGDVRIVDKKGQVVAEGEIGEIVVSGIPMNGYWKAGAHRRDDRDGWLHTGDLADGMKRATSISWTAKKTCSLPEGKTYIPPKSKRSFIPTRRSLIWNHRGSR